MSAGLGNGGKSIASIPRAPGAIVGERYRIVRVIARGGTGVVYEAEHTWTERRVAVKMLLPRLADGEAQIRRFHQEAKSAAKLVHPNIVEIIDMGRDGGDGALFLVQALLVGEDLEQRLERVKRLRPDELLDVLRPILDALQTAHRHGVLHRDIKPSNIFLVAVGANEKGDSPLPPPAGIPDGGDLRKRLPAPVPSVYRSPGPCVPKLIDFGSSKRIDDDSDLVKLTQSGSLVGTPIYMSPEQIRGQPLDVRTDIWSIGVVMYKALTGSYPFDASNFAVLFSQILTARAPRVEQRGVPRHFADIVHRALATDRDERFPSVTALIDALEAPAPEASASGGASASPSQASEERTLIDGAIPDALQQARRALAVFPPISDELTNVPAENERIEDSSVDEIVALVDGRSSSQMPPMRVVAEPTPTPAPYSLRKPVFFALPARRPGRAPWRGSVRLGLVAPRAASADVLRSFEQAVSNHARWSVRRFPSYSTLVDALCEDEVELAWLPPVAYLRARRLGPVHLLLGLARGGPTSYGSALVATQRAGIRDLEDVRGKRVAWVDVWSAAGYLMPRGVLREAGLDPAQVFASQAFVGSHRAVLDAIAEGRADLGATFCSLDEQGMLVAAPWSDRPGFVPVALSGAIPGDAICAAGELSLKDAEAMVAPLLELADDADGAAVLKRVFGTPRFVGVDPSFYQVLEGV